MVNAVGSVLGKLCSKCQCSWNWDCSRKTVILIARPGNVQDLAGARQIIEQVGRDLRQGIEQMQNLFEDAEPVHHSEKVKDDAQSDHSTMVDLGILTVTNRFLKEFETIEEGWSKLDFACAISAVDLREKLKQQEPLSKEEWKKLHHAVHRVKKYGSMAVFLWKLIRAHEGNIEGLWQIGALSMKQRSILAAHLIPEADYINPISFALLDLRAKKAFFDAAHCAHKEIRLHLTPHLFTEREIEDDTLSINSQKSDHSPLQISRKLDGARSERKETYERFLKEVGGVLGGEEQDRENLLISLGAVRVQVLAIRIGVTPEVVIKGDIEVNLLEKLKGEWPSLLALAGGIFYLFSLLKGSIKISALKEKEFITDRKLECLIELTKNQPRLFYLIKKVSELAALPAEYIAILSRVAEKFSREELLGLADRYPLDLWLSEKRDGTPRLGGSDGPSSEEAQPNGNPSPFTSPAGSSEDE